MDITIQAQGILLHITVELTVADYSRADIMAYKCRAYAIA
jgi:hypothetical protein